MFYSNILYIVYNMANTINNHNHSALFSKILLEEYKKNSNKRIRENNILDGDNSPLPLKKRFKYTSLYLTQEKVEEKVIKPKSIMSSQFWLDIFNNHVVKYMNSAVELSKLIQIDRTFYNNLKFEKLFVEKSHLLSPDLLRGRGIRELILNNLEYYTPEKHFNFDNLNHCRMTLNYLELNFGTKQKVTDPLIYDSEYYGFLINLEKVKISGLKNKNIIDFIARDLPSLETLILEKCCLKDSHLLFMNLSNNKTCPNIHFINCSGFYEMNIFNTFIKTHKKLTFKDCENISSDFSITFEKNKNKIIEDFRLRKKELKKKYSFLDNIFDSEDVFLKKANIYIEQYIIKEMVSNLYFDYYGKFISY
jgi:hypothetical protein